MTAPQPGDLWVQMRTGDAMIVRGMVGSLVLLRLIDEDGFTADHEEPVEEFEHAAAEDASWVRVTLDHLTEPAETTIASERWSRVIPVEVVATAMALRGGA